MSRKSITRAQPSCPLLAAAQTPSSRRRRRAGVVLACVAGLVGATQRVHAGPLETMRDVVFHPSDPEVFAATYAEAGGGVLITRDGGESFELLCSSAIRGESDIGASVPAAVWNSQGRLLFGGSKGLFRSDDAGCAFEAIPELTDLRVAQLSVHPEQPSTLFAVTSTNGQANGVFRSEDDGASWSALGQRETGFFGSLRLTKLADGSERIYLSVCTPSSDGTTIGCELRVSEDALASHRAEPMDDAVDLRVLGVDPTNPDRVYVAAARASASGEVLLVSDQAGVAGSFRELAELGKLGTFVTLPEGGFWAVDVQQRALFKGAAGEDTATQVESVSQLSCFARDPHSGQSYACATWLLFAVDEAGKAQGAPVLDMNEVSDFVSCEGTNVAQECKLSMDYGWCGPRHFPDAPICGGTPSEVDAGSADAGVASADPDAGVKSAPDKSGGCAVVAAQPRQQLPILLAFALLAWSSRARSRRRAPASRR